MNNNLTTIIQHRRSTYPTDFSNKEITKTDLEELLSVIPYTPNHKKTTPWRFQVFQKEAKTNLGNHLASLYETHTDPSKFSERKQKGIIDKAEKSSAIATITIKVSGLVPEWEEVAAVAMSVQNIWLKATSMGIGGYWSSPKLISYMNDFLHLEADEKCLGLFYLGYPNTPFEEQQKDWKEFVKFID